MTSARSRASASADLHPIEHGFNYPKCKSTSALPAVSTSADKDDGAVPMLSRVLTTAVNLTSIRRCLSTVDKHSYNPSSNQKEAPGVCLSSPREEASLSVQNSPLVFVVVDDNSINRLLLRKLVTMSYRCDVHTAENGRAGLELVKSCMTPSGRRVIVLTDIHMPEVDGLQMTQNIRLLWSSEVLPIIGVTADHSSQLADECMECGMQAVLTKPVLGPHLFQTVNSVINSFWGRLPTECLVRTAMEG